MKPRTKLAKEIQVGDTVCIANYQGVSKERKVERIEPRPWLASLCFFFDDGSYGFYGHDMPIPLECVVKNLIEYMTEVKGNPEFLKIQAELVELDKQMKAKFAELNEKFPVPEGRVWALNAANTLGIYSYATEE